MERKITKLIVLIAGMALIGCSGEEKSTEETPMKVKVEKIKTDGGTELQGSDMSKKKEAEFEEFAAEDGRRKYEPSVRTSTKGGQSPFTPEELLAFGKAIFSDEGEYSNYLVEEGSGFSAQDISMVKRDACAGNECGRSMFLVNSNPERGVRASVETVWKVGQYYDAQLTNYELLPGSEKYMGCSNYCGSGNNIPVKRKILSSQYMN